MSSQSNSEQSPATERPGRREASTPANPQAAGLGLGRGPGLGLALLLVVLLSFSSGAVGEAQAIWPFDGIFERPPLAERAAKLLAEAIRTPTSNPPGNERALARKLAAALGRAGIENGVLDTPSLDDEPPRAAVWGRIRGTGRPPGTGAALASRHRARG